LVSGESRRCEVRPSRYARRQMSRPYDESPERALFTENLPHPNTKRWVVRRKAAIIAAVRSGGLTIEEACRIYQFSNEELLSWDRAFELHGLAGLRATRLQRCRARRLPEAPLPAVETVD